MRARPHYVIWTCIAFVLLVAAAILGWHHWLSPPLPDDARARPAIASSSER